jgi:phosphatidylserine decarboxylase
MTQTTTSIPSQRFLREDPSPPIAREGWPIVAAFVLVSALATWGAYALLGGVVMAAVGAIGAVLTLWCIWFFRDPPRSTPGDPSLVIAPADGVVVLMGPAKPPPELALRASQEEQMQRVCIFMNVFNVHVNRAPVSGVVVASHYHPGKFFNASLDKASEHNERSSLAMRTADGQVVAFVQIAGLVARRIISRAKEGDPFRAGQRYGLIRFGSRVDVYLPKGSAISVAINQKTVAGETVIASLPKAPTPTG